MNVVVKIANSRQDRERIYHFRYRLHTLGLGQMPACANHDKQWIEHPLDDNATLLFAERRSGEIIGTLRLALGKSFVDPSIFIEKSSDFEDVIELMTVDSCSKIDDLLLNPDYKNLTMISLLFNTAFHILIKNDIPVTFTTCHSSLQKFFERLGFKSLRNSKNKNDKHMLLLPQYIKSLQQVLSPFTHLVSKESSNAENIHNKLKHLLQNNGQTSAVPICDLHTFWARFSDHLARLIVSKPSFFNGLETNEVQQILTLSDRLTMNAGEAFPALVSPYLKLGVILQGEIGLGQIREKGQHHWVSILHEGDALSVDMNIPEVQFIAMETTEIALFPKNLIELLKAKNPILATRLSMNLMVCQQHETDALERFQEDHLDEYQLDRLLNIALA